MICFGIANTIAAAASSMVAKLVGRNKILGITLVLHAALLMYMHEWTAVPNDLISYCSMAAVWGLLDGTWLVIINCMLNAYSSIFLYVFFFLYCFRFLVNSQSRLITHI